MARARRTSAILETDRQILKGLKSITASGNVGVGRPDPAYKLDVQGDICASGTIFAKYQHVAEWVPSSEKLSAGTVVVLDQAKSNQVVASTTAYDTRVAGVISAQPGITLGEKSKEKVLVGATGRVRVMVDATKAPINIGDLVTSESRRRDEIGSSESWRRSNPSPRDDYRQSTRAARQR